jgi:hypothetical protein
VDELIPEVFLELRSGDSLYTAHHGKQAGNLEHEQQILSEVVLKTKIDF